MKHMGKRKRKGEDNRRGVKGVRRDEEGEVGRVVGGGWDGKEVKGREEKEEAVEE